MTASDKLKPTNGSDRLPRICCTTSLILLLVSVALGILVFSQIIPIHWDSVVLPFFTVFILVPASLFALLLSGWSLIRHRDKRSLVAVIAALIALPASLFDAFVVFATALAGHPV